MIPGTKRTWLRTWAEFQTRRPTEAEVRAWWGRWPASGVAVVCGAVSGLVVVDVDPRNDGEAGWAQLVATHGAPPSTRRTISGRGDGGRHYWFAHPGGGVVVPTVDLAPGVQRLGDGHLLVAPPSLHPSSNLPYRWAEGGEPAPAPAWVLEATSLSSSSSATSSARGAGRRRATTGPPLSMEQSAEFVELWRGLGVDVVGESGEVLRHCPFHHDEDPSLRVDVGRGVWWCFPCNIGGGLRDLRQRATGSADRPPCRGFSIEPKDQASNRESATSLPLCGVNRRMRNRQTAVVMDMQLPCKRYRCERCGPAVRAARLAHYLPAMEGQDWYRVIVSPEQRQTFNKRLTRAGAPSLRVPAEPGRTVVFTTMVFGEVVGDLEQALTSAFAAVPGDGRQVRAAGGLPPMTSGADVDESEWEMLGVVSVSIEESAEIAQACGVFRGWVDERFVPAGGRALLLDDQRPGWAWFCRRTGLHTPQPRRRVTLPPEVATGGVRRR